MEKLQGTGTRDGDFVLQGQKVADEQGFRNVSKHWYDKTMSFDEGIEMLHSQQRVIQDALTPISDWHPCVNADGDFALSYHGNNPKVEQGEYVPNERALRQLATFGGLRSGQCEDLTKSSTGDDGIKRDIRDADLLCYMFETHLFDPVRTSHKKDRLFRTWSDNHTIRAFLSDQYAIVNNEWFLKTIQELVPGGRLSHWRGNADSIWGNVLIPDSIREEDDSEYGGMVSIGNSEVGERTVYTLPSIFRAICMNGCIWDQEEGEEIRVVHKGEIDLIDLKARIKNNLETQIPLLPAGIERMLGLRAMGTDGVPMMNIVTQLYESNAVVGRSDARGIFKQLEVEHKVLGKDVNSLFGLQAAVTRYGQTKDNKTWYDMDRLGGRLLALDANEWDRMKVAAKHLKPKRVELAMGI
jgi:hypothetical protein